MGHPQQYGTFLSPRINCLRESVQGEVFKFSILCDYFHLVGYYFLDDSVIIQVAPSTDTPLEETVKLAQKGLNIFPG